MYARFRDAYSVLIRRRKFTTAPYPIAERGCAKLNGQSKYFVTLTSCHAILRSDVHHPQGLI